MQLTAEPGTVNLLTTELPVVCGHSGVVDLSEKDYDAILPHDVIDELQQLPVAPVMVAECVSMNDESSVSANVVNNQVVNESEDDDVDVSNGKSCNNSDLNDEVVSDDVDKLIAEQKSDETLSDCWDMAHQGTGNFVISRGML